MEINQPFSRAHCGDSAKIYIMRAQKINIFSISQRAAKEKKCALWAWKRRPLVSTATRVDLSEHLSLLISNKSELLFCYLCDRVLGPMFPMAFQLLDTQLRPSSQSESLWNFNNSIYKWRIFHECNFQVHTNMLSSIHAEIC